MHFTSIEFKEEIEKAIPHMRISMYDDDDSYQVTVITDVMNWDRKVKRAQEIVKKWENKGYEVTFSAFQNALTMIFDLWK